MIRIFHKIKSNLTGPIFVHIVTQKGKGYEYAEDDAAKFHGLGPYEIKTGKCKKKKAESYSKIFGNTLCKLAEKNKNIVAITAAMTDGTGLTDFAQKFPDKFFDVGIAEQHAVTFAGGLAVQGLKPFVAIYSTFLQRALDQVIHDIALQKLPVVFCLDRAGLVGDDGATHHGVFDLSYLNLIPGILILIPINAKELSSMLEFAANYNDGPVVIRYPRGNALTPEKEIDPIEIGKSSVIHKGKDVAIIGVGKAMEDAEQIFNDLKNKLPGVEPYLINPRFLKPLDTKFFKELEKQVHTVITIEDNALIGGFGSTIKSFYSNSNINVHSFGIPDKFIEHGTIDQLKDMIGISTDKITKKIISILK
jgi:1-deoxy-D-xylulose-5-phosphate synthase